MEIVLASTSSYRSSLLQRLQLPFRCLPPVADESPLPGEEAAALALRLALAKANSVAASHPRALVIGSDQVASLDGVLLGKPGSHAAAAAQLQACSGRTLLFHTAVALRCLAQDIELHHTEPFEVQFRQLSERTIEDYLQQEKPYDCAGSFKCEGLGIALFRSLNGRDPTSLEGLPLIALTSLLQRAGAAVLAD